MTQDHSAWLGHFTGSNYGFDNYEILTVQNIPHKDMGKEAELMSVKWFDYRLLHPMEATYYFFHIYNTEYRQFYRKTLDYEAAPYVRIIKERDFLHARERLTFWRLRQLVDRLGMRYEFFMCFAMNWYYRLTDKTGQIYAPRPAMLLNNEDLIADAMLAWEEQCDVSLQIARSPCYRVSNFIGSRNQIEHEAFVIEQVKRRTVPKFSLHAAMYLHDAVRIEEAACHFDEGVINGAIVGVEIPDEISQH